MVESVLEIGCSVVITEAIMLFTTGIPWASRLRSIDSSAVHVLDLERREWWTLDDDGVRRMEIVRKLCI